MALTKAKLYLTNATSLVKYGEQTWNKPSFDVYFGESDMTESGWVFVRDLEIDLPAIVIKDLINPAIGTMRKQISKIRAEAYKAEMELEKEINEILMIGHDAPAEQEPSLGSIVENAVEAAVPQARDNIVDDGYDDIPW